MAEAKKTTKKAESRAKSVKDPIKPAVKLEKVNEAVEAKELNAEASDVNTEEPTQQTISQKPLAKAGKRSAKAVAEKEAVTAKQERKAAKEDTGDVKKATQKPARSKAERAGKKYREAHKLVDPGKTYSLSDAVDLAIKTSTTKFDSSVELHVRLGVDPKLADQNVRGSVVLPAGTGKAVRIAVICEPTDESAARKAGGDIVGSEEVFAMLDKQQLDFEVLVAAPSQMARLGKYAKTLGPRGLMPSPKSGTVSADVAKAVTEAKSGKVEFRVDSAGIIHLAVGKVSFGNEKLIQNLQAVVLAIKSAKPASLKGNYVVSTFIATTMGPSIRSANE